MKVRHIVPLLNNRALRDTLIPVSYTHLGMDNYRAGQTAAGLLRLMLPEGGKVLPLAGHLNNTAHNNRLNGFMDTINSETGNEIELLAFQPCFDRDDYAHEITPVSYTHLLIYIHLI